MATRIWWLMGLALLGVPVPAWPWGCEGHQIIALIAQHHLTPHARDAVAHLLQPSAIDPQLHRACTPVGDAMADASTWADDVRGDSRSRFYGTAGWHFIDIPLEAPSADLRPYCPPATGCVLTAIKAQRAVLQAASSDRREMAEALMFLLHLVGDLHQPLHCSTNNDLGGNCVPVAFFGTQPRLSPGRKDNGVYHPNLHAVWDANILWRAVGHRTPASVAAALERRFAPRLASWQREDIDVDQWAWESHALAVQIAYGVLPVRIAPRPPRHIVHCTRVAPPLLALHERLGQDYQDAAAPAVEEQLTKAGIRLAMILNQRWP